MTEAFNGNIGDQAGVVDPIPVKQEVVEPTLPTVGLEPKEDFDTLYRNLMDSYKLNRNQLSEHGSGEWDL